VDLLRRIETDLQHRASFEPRHLANVINGLAKLGHDPGPSFLSSFVAACEASRLRGFNAQDLSTSSTGWPSCGMTPARASCRASWRRARRQDCGVSIRRSLPWSSTG
jgi:hypothetical protein